MTARRSPSRAARTRPGTGPARGPVARPAARRDAPPPRPREPATRTRRTGGLTTRAAVLALVVCALAVSLAYPLREYLQQRAQTASLAARVAEQTQQVQAEREQVARWQDPAYVRAQAKARLRMVDPGERQYVVVEPERPARAKAAGAAAATQTRPWFGSLWASVEEADASRPAARPAAE
ncbi:cell division protein FtsB [Motilibacter peucedani]|uniref:Cell division protein FtsB n=1 Tax=Motilibacter peucedani TaxID=598650 RepID=A0A420XL38_9ACTN|nr:septum formation initiator family protein [Motilibacter peucedani]RKS68625.1 cell division protein FtsB [Motilibacter peucedani]